MRSIYQFVPIHRGVLLQGLVISLRARADGLLEQVADPCLPVLTFSFQVDHAVDPLFGIYVLVQHSGQHAESIR